MSSPSSRRALLTLALLCFSLAWLAAPARADVVISAAPSLLEISATPGGTGSQDLTVSNAGSESFHVTAEVAQYKSGEGSLSAVSWLKVEPSSFELAPGQRLTAKVTIAVPANLDSGSRYAMVAFRTGEKPTRGSAVGVAAQVGVPFLITVRGTGVLTRQASLEELVPVLEPDGHLGFRVIVGNEGNTHFYARGTVDVTRSDGSPAGRITLRETTAVLPGARETLYSDQPISFQDGEAYRARAEVSYGDANQLAKEIEFGATARLEIGQLSALTTSGGELKLRMQLTNQGGLGLLPHIMMAIRGADGKLVGAVSPNQPPLMLPGQSAEVDATYPGRLAPGNYTLVARAEFGAAPVQQETPFQIGAASAGGPTSVPVTSWAEAPGKQEVAGFTPTVPTQAGQPTTLVAGAVGALLPLAVLFLFLSKQSWKRPRRASAASAAPAALPRPPAALPPPAAFCNLVARQFVRRRPRRIQVTPRAPAALPPPPARYLLAAPAQTDPPAGQGEPVVQAERVPVADESAEVHPAGANAEQAAALVALARRAGRSGDWATVYRLSWNVLLLNPRNVDAWLLRAAGCDDAQMAQLCLSAALGLDPENAIAKHGLDGLRARLTGNGESSE